VYCSCLFRIAMHVHKWLVITDRQADKCTAARCSLCARRVALQCVRLKHVTLSSMKIQDKTEELVCIFFPPWRRDPTRAMASSFLMFLDHTRQRTTVDRTPLDEWSARSTNLYLTTHNTHYKHPCTVAIRTHNLSWRATADVRLGPRGLHWV